MKAFKLRTYFYYTILLLALTSGQISTPYADTFELIPTLYLFNYKEFGINNQLLDEEDGIIPGIRLGLNHNIDNEQLQLHAAIFDGSVDYTGQTQSGTPHHTDTNTQLLNLGLLLTPKQNIPDLPGKLFIGYQYWRWDRDILTRHNEVIGGEVRGLHEIYNWHEFQAGIKFQYNIDQNYTLWLQASGLYIVNPNMKIYLESTREKLNLGSEAGYRIHMGAEKKVNKQMNISLGLFIESWSFDRSNSVFTNDFFGTPALLTEPRSESFHSGLELSLIHLF